MHFQRSSGHVFFLMLDRGIQCAENFNETLELFYGAHMQSGIEFREDIMLTAKGKYGLKALVHLAKLKPGETVQAAEIAKSNSISKKFLDAILRDLRTAGLVQAKRGPRGGYMLAHRPEDIKVGNAIRELDGPLAPIACASRTAYKPCRDCKTPDRCVVRITMTKVRDAISDVLDRMTLADLVATKMAVRKR